MTHSLESTDGQIIILVLTSLAYSIPWAVRTSFPITVQEVLFGRSPKISSSSLSFVALLESKDLIKTFQVKSRWFQKVHQTSRFYFHPVEDSATQRYMWTQRSGFSFRLTCDSVVCKTEISIKSTALSSNSLPTILQSCVYASKSMFQPHSAWHRNQCIQHHYFWAQSEILSKTPSLPRSIWCVWLKPTVDNVVILKHQYRCCFAHEAAFYLVSMT